jgi:4'-phosphopantetheinyl transferase
MVICAAVSSARIGVDTEKREPRDVGDMNEYFTPGEWDAVVTSEDANAAFYKMWVRKEACVKAIGKGVFLPLNEIDVSDDEVLVGAATWFLYDLPLMEGYATCIATNEQNDLIKIIEADLNSLVNQIIV